MSKIQLNELLEQFKEEGINPHLNIQNFQADYHHFADKKTPVFIQVLMFFGALLAAGFFLLFLALGGLFESAIFLFVLGVIIMAGGISFPYMSKQEAAVEPIGMAFLIVGAVLFTAGFFMNNNNGSFAFVLSVWVILSVIIMIIAGSHLQKLAAILCANACLLGLIWEFHIPVGFNFLVLINATVLTVFWLKEGTILEEFKSLGQWYNAITNGCSISMLAILCLSVNNEMYSYETGQADPSYWWISAILLVALVLWVLDDTLDLIHEEKKKLVVLGSAGIALLLLVSAPGIIAGILLLLLGVYAGYWMFAGQGILAIFFFTGMFYYNLETTLLLKSGLMVLSGLIFLGIGVGLRKFSVESSK